MVNSRKVATRSACFPSAPGKIREMLEALRKLPVGFCILMPLMIPLPNPKVKVYQVRELDGWEGWVLLQELEIISFETLLLQSRSNKDGNMSFGRTLPVWEVEEVKSDERTKISVPDNLPQLYTLQSRRLFLKRHENYVTGYLLLGGDFFDRENAFIEHMTIWRNAARRSSDTPEYHPRRHNPSRQLWRDFSVLAGQSETIRRPGIVNWIAG